MRKNIIIAALIATVIVSFISTCQMSSRASYWMKRSDAAESVIDQMWEDMPAYMGDVMSETDVYSNWEEYK